MRRAVVKRVALAFVIVAWLFAMHRLHPNLVPEAWLWLTSLSPFYGLVGVAMVAVSAWLILSVLTK